jgi:UDP-N-acetylmuramate--alanine ligase
MGYTRVVAVFQPHLYTRTRDFSDRFAESLSAADVAVVTGIYASREEPIEGVTSESIVEAMGKNGYTSAHFVAHAGDTVGLLAPMVKPGDAVVLLGAGDIGNIARPLLKGIRDGS